MKNSKLKQVNVSISPTKYAKARRIMKTKKHTMRLLVNHALDLYVSGKLKPQAASAS